MAQFYINYESARQLVEQFPDEAINFIARNFELNGIVNALNLAERNSRSNHSDRSVSEFENKSGGASTHTSSTGSHQFASAPIAQMPSSRKIQQTAPVLPPSPATGSSSSRLPSAKLRPEYIIAIIDGPEEEPVQEHKLSAKKASVDFNFISEEVVRTRLIDGVVITELPESLDLPHPGVPGDVLQSSEKVFLTWRRPSSYKTREKWFHMVSKRIEVDVILGYSDSTKDQQQGEISSPHRNRFIPRQNIANLYPPAPEVTANHPGAHSYHSSSHMYEPNTAPQNQEMVEAFLSRTLGSDAAATPRARVPHRPSPAPTAILQPTPANTHEQPARLDQISVAVVWDLASLVISLDLSLTAEDMLKNIDRAYRRGFRKNLDRRTHLIRFNSEESVEIGQGHVLFFNKANEDWNPTVHWIKQNRNVEPPHVYAFIEPDED